MISKARGELAAAIAIAAGVLLAAGYCITWAQLSNEGLPTRAILSALPQSFYFGAALGGLILPLVIVATLGTTLLVLRVRDEFPSWKEWAVFGVILAAYSRFLVTLGDVRLFGSWTGDTVVWSLVAAAGIVLITAVLGVLGGIIVSNIKGVDRLDRLQIAGAILVVTSVVAASAFRVVDASSVSEVLPYADVWLDTDDCPPAPDIRTHKVAGGQTPDRCRTGGFYLGENDQWVYVVRKAGVEGLPGRLLFLPRDHVRFAATATGPLIPNPGD